MAVFRIETDDGTFDVDADNEQAALSVFAPKKQQAAGDIVKGTANEALQGATFGFSDEIQSVIAAAVASPFVSDKTFSQLMVDARNSLRDEQGEFRKENPKTAITANIAGGLATGGGLFKGAQTVKSLATAGAVTGGVAGAGFSDSDKLISTDTAVDTAIGATGGAILGAGIGKALEKVSGVIQQRLNLPDLQIFDEAGKYTDDAIAELEKKVTSGAITREEVGALIKQGSDSGGVLTPEQAKRYNLFIGRKITPTRANLTQSADDFSQQQSAVKRSGPVSETVAKQDEQLTDLTRKGIEGTKGVAQSLPEANASVFSVIDDIVTKSDEAMGAAYQQADKVAGQQFKVTPERLLKAIQDNRGPELNRPVISHIVSVLRNRGVFTKGAGIDPQKGAARTSADNLKPITVREAEEIRKELNQLWDSVKPQGRRLIGKLKSALDDDVEWYAADKEIFKTARQLKIDYHKLIEKGRRNKFDETRRSFLEDVIENKIPEENIIPRLLSGRDDDFLKMKEFLTKDAGGGGVKAWNNVRASVLRDALDKATGTMGKGEGGQPVFNVRLFKQSIAGLRNSKKFTELFNKDEINLIDDIIKIGNLRIPVSSVQQGKGPTELAVNELRKEVLRKLPFVGERAQGLIDAVTNLRADRRLLDVNRETVKALKKP